MHAHHKAPRPQGSGHDKASRSPRGRDHKHQPSTRPAFRSLEQSIDIPTEVEQAVQQFQKGNLASLRLTAIAGEHYAFARVLAIRRYDGSVVITNVLLPGASGRVSAVLTLHKHYLRQGDRYVVITIHRSAAGVWFMTQDSEGYTASPSNVIPSRNHFPMIFDHLDNQEGPKLLAKLSQWTHIEFNLNEQAQFDDYRALPLGDFHADYEQLNDERHAAMKALGENIVRTADTHHLMLAERSGYSVDFDSSVATIEDRERVEAVEQQNAVYELEERVSTNAELIAATAPVSQKVPAFVRRPSFVRQSSPRPEPETPKEAQPTEQRRPMFVRRTS